MEFLCLTSGCFSKVDSLGSKDNSARGINNHSFSLTIPSGRNGGFHRTTLSTNSWNKQRHVPYDLTNLTQFLRESRSHNKSAVLILIPLTGNMTGYHTIKRLTINQKILKLPRIRIGITPENYDSFFSSIEKWL